MRYVKGEEEEEEVPYKKGWVQLWQNGETACRDLLNMMLMS